MQELSLEQIAKLEQIGKDFDCEFCFPPFKDTNSSFFAIDELAESPAKLAKFILNVNGMGLGHELHKIDGKRYLEVLSGG